MKKEALIALMRAYKVDDGPLECVFWRLHVPSPLFTWKLSFCPPRASVDHARSWLLSASYANSTAEVFVMQDGDQTAPPEAYDQLASKALELDSVVSCLLSKRAFGQGFVNKLIPEKHDAPGIPYPADEVWELQEGEYAPAAMTAYPRTVIERLTRHLPWVHGPHGVPDADTSQGFWPLFKPYYKEINGLLRYIPENRAFCDLCREHGEKIYTWFLPRVEHHGDIAYGPETASQVISRAAWPSTMEPSSAKPTTDGMSHSPRSERPG